MKIASHCNQPSVSPRNGTARMATKIGKVFTTGITRDTSSERSVRSIAMAPPTRMMPEAKAISTVVPSVPAGIQLMVKMTTPTALCTTPIGAMNA